MRLEETGVKSWKTPSPKLRSLYSILYKCQMSPMLSATSNDSLSLSAKGLQSHGKIELMHKNVQNS